MKQLKLKTILLLLAAFLFAFQQSSVAQETEIDVEQEDTDVDTDAEGDLNKNRFKRWTITLNGGILNPYTDITQYDYYKVWKYENENQLAGGLAVGYALNNIFTIRGQGLYGKLQGTLRPGPSDPDADYQIPVSALTSKGLPANGVYWNTSILEGGVQLLVNLRNLAFSGSMKERKLNYFMYLGHGLVKFETQIYRLGTDDQPIANSAYKRGYSGDVTEAVNPLGVILRYKLSRGIDLGLDLSMRRVNGDKLDAFEAGNANDYYGFWALDLTFKPGFGTDSDSAESIDWVNPMEVMYEDLQDVKGTLALFTGDKDNDGVGDYWDKDNATEEGAVVSGGGVALDIDEDGVPDFKDEDPFTPKGATVDASGKAIDSDGDGVPDALDLEPNTEKGALVNFQGMTIDGAGDGAVAGEAVYFPPVIFAFDRSNIRYSEYEKLAVIARALKNNPGLKVTMIGHADNRGDEKYNMELARKRAQSVVDHLVKYYGVSADRMSVESKGENEPLANGIYVVNRRVDVRAR